jgi:hypothetical protein
MPLTKITFTGVDNNTDLKKLNKLSNDYPFIEWGVLFSRSKQGIDPRYPDLYTISDFMNLEKITKSAHLCGAWVKNLINSEYSNLVSPYAIYTLFGPFQRYQLNISGGLKDFNGDVFNQYSCALNKMSYLNPNSLNGFQEKPHYIIQSKTFDLDLKNKCELVPLHLIDVLLDCSGGVGKELNVVAPPGNFSYTPGFAGGINPENVENILEKIEALKIKQNYWIDMESGVRTDNWLDLDKCEAIVKIAKRFVKK